MTFIGALKSHRELRWPGCNPIRQSARYNSHNTIRMMQMIQSTQCNHKADPCICKTATMATIVTMASITIAIMTTTRVTRATTLQGLWWPQGHYGHGVTMATSVTTFMTVTKVTRTTKTQISTTDTMTTTATTATAALISCWLHKISEVGALTSRSFTYISNFKGSQVSAPLEDQRT